MVQHGAATGITSVLSTKLLQTVHCQRRALHHCGDPDRFQTTGLTVDSLSRRVPIDIGKCARTAHFPSHAKLSACVQPIKVGHHETRLHLDFVDWRSTQSHHDEPNLPQRTSYGMSLWATEKTYQRSHERPFALFVNVQPFARVCHLIGKFVHPHEVT